MNVHDSERIAGLLDEAGYAPVADGAQPDVVVFSGCAVRENADNKLDGNLGHLSFHRPPRYVDAPHEANERWLDSLAPRGAQETSAALSDPMSMRRTSLMS
jgi:hypothetical protein